MYEINLKFLNNNYLIFLHKILTITHDYFNIFIPLEFGKVISYLEFFKEKRFKKRNNRYIMKVQFVVH